MSKISWTKTEQGFTAQIGNVSLNAVPVNVKFGKPARGTQWRACKIPA